MNIEIKLKQAQDMKDRLLIVQTWKDRILEKYFNYREFSEVTGIHTSLISKYINGIHVPFWPQINKVESFLDPIDSDK